jgi:SNF2 family DNA or RNA helicase
MPDSIDTTSTELPLARLSSYLRAIAKLSNADLISKADLLEAAGDLTHTQIVQDLFSFGITGNDPFPRHRLARVIRKSTHNARRRSASVTFAPFVAPPLESILEDLSVTDAKQPAHRGEMTEAAYEYATLRPDLFFLGHGLIRNEPVTEASEGANAKQEAVALKHQITEARKIVEQMLGNAIVVHEVGLGKTLTGILVLYELLLRDRHLSSLILVPTNLRKQWLEELSRCPDISIYSGRDPGEVASQRHVLMPVDTAKEERWAKILTPRRWGLLMIDEGHILRNDNTARFRFAYSLRALHRVLLTATPVHNSAYDIYHQVNIVRPGLFGRKNKFAEDHMRDERQVQDAESLREALNDVVSRMRRDDTGISFPTRDIDHVLVSDRSKLESELYEDVLNVLRGIYRRSLGSAAYLRRPSGNEQGVATIVLVSILVLRELGSHPLAALKTLSKSLVKRVERIAKLTGDTTDLDALNRVVAKYSAIEWKEGTHAKTDRLIEYIPDLVKEKGRVIVYVEFRETQKIIIQRLQSKAVRAALPPKTVVIPYHGELTVTEKDDQVARFNRSARACFISTDAGGQGLNLQSGYVVLNFDFPWNPMRVEQRIGRVDRYRQKSPEVLIRNFITTETIEQYVYNTLRSKLKVCDDVLGHLIPRIFKLSGVQEKYLSDYDTLGIGQIILSSENEKDLRAKFGMLDKELEERLSSEQLPWRPPRRFDY